MKLSVCIPTFNRAGHLTNCLEALRVSRERAGIEVEVCVSDNASTDGTRAAVEAAQKRMPVTYRRNDSNLGIARNIVDAAGMASGEFVWILGDDDLVLPHALATLAGLIDANPRADYFFVNSSEVDSALVMAAPQPFDASTLPPDLPRFSSLTASGPVKFHELVDPRVSFDFLLGIFLSVFRRSKWVENLDALDQNAVSDMRTFAHFDNSAPHLKVFAKAFARSDAYLQAEPLTACLKGARAWAPMYPFIKSVRIVEAVDEYRRHGLPLGRWLRCKNAALDTFLPDLANMFVHRDRSGWAYVDPLKLVAANCFFPNFYLSPFYYAARKLKGMVAA